MVEICSTVVSSQMSVYERWALILSVIAILIPIIQWLWEKLIVKPIILYYPTGKTLLFINKDGSYIQIYGVIESQNKPVTIRSIKLKIRRKNDDSSRNLSWSTIISPISQQINGIYSSTTEFAHPFRIEADSISCAFIEYTDEYDSPSKILQPHFEQLHNVSSCYHVNEASFSDALSRFQNTQEYKDAKESLQSELFWKIGEYQVDVIVDYGKVKTFSYQLTINNDNFRGLNNNIKQTLDSYIYTLYGVPTSLKPIQVELREIK